MAFLSEMPETQRSEDLSKAYVRAVAAQAGFISTKPENDFGIDLVFNRIITIESLSKERGTEWVEDLDTVPLRAQIKSTKHWEIKNGYVHCRLTARAYDMAVRGRGKIVVLMMCYPREFEQRLRQNGKRLHLRHCCYYWKPRTNATMTPNDTTKTISIPATQVFTPTALQELFEAVQAGSWS